MIKSFNHKGLRLFWESGAGNIKGINADHKAKLGDQLAALDSAVRVSDMDLPGWRLHPLKGQGKGRYSVEVSGNWRLTFKFENGDARAVDYEDYH